MDQSTYSGRAFRDTEWYVHVWRMQIWVPGTTKARDLDLVILEEQEI